MLQIFDAMIDDAAILLIFSIFMPWLIFAIRFIAMLMILYCCWWWYFRFRCHEYLRFRCRHLILLMLSMSAVIIDDAADFRHAIFAAFIDICYFRLMRFFYCYYATIPGQSMLSVYWCHWFRLFSFIYWWFWWCHYAADDADIIDDADDVDYDDALIDWFLSPGRHADYAWLITDWWLITDYYAILYIYVISFIDILDAPLFSFLFIDYFFQYWDGASVLPPGHRRHCLPGLVCHWLLSSPRHYATSFAEAAIYCRAAWPRRHADPPLFDYY